MNAQACELILQDCGFESCSLHIKMLSIRKATRLLHENSIPWKNSACCLRFLLCLELSMLCSLYTAICFLYIHFTTRTIVQSSPSLERSVDGTLWDHPPCATALSILALVALHPSFMSGYHLPPGGQMRSKQKWERAQLEIRTFTKVGLFAFRTPSRHDSKYRWINKKL